MPSPGFIASLTTIIWPGLVIQEVAESLLGPDPCLLGKSTGPTQFSLTDLMGCPCCKRTVQISPPLVLIVPLPPVPTQYSSVSFSEPPVSPPQSPSEGLDDRASPSHLCCWFCGGQHLLQACPHGPAPTGTCNPASHVPVTPPNLHFHSAPTLWHVSAPQVDGTPDSPALHGNVDDSDQDIMMTGYDQPTKPMSNVLLLENLHFWLPYHHRLQGR